MTRQMRWGTINFRTPRNARQRGALQGVHVDFLVIAETIALCFLTMLAIPDQMVCRVHR